MSPMPMAVLATPVPLARRRQHRLPRLVLRRVLRQVGLRVDVTIGPDVGPGCGVVLGDREYRRRHRRCRRRCSVRRSRWRGRRSRELWYPLPGQRGVGIAFPVLAVVERYVVLIAFAHLHRRSALARTGFTRDVAGAADILPGILRNPAVEVTRGSVGRIGLVRG